MQFPGAGKSTSSKISDTYDSMKDYSHLNPSAPSNPTSLSTSTNAKDDPKNFVKVDVRTSLLTVVFNISIQEFSKSLERLIIGAIADITNTNVSKIHAYNIESGSLKITVEFPAELDYSFMAQLLSALQSHSTIKHLNPVGMLSNQLSADDKHTILYLAASPSDQAVLRSDKEFRAIQDALNGATKVDPNVKTVSG